VVAKVVEKNLQQRFLNFGFIKSNFDCQVDSYIHTVLCRTALEAHMDYIDESQCNRQEEITFWV